MSKCNHGMIFFKIGLVEYRVCPSEVRYFEAKQKYIDIYYGNECTKGILSGTIKALAKKYPTFILIRRNLLVNPELNCYCAYVYQVYCP